MRLTKCTVTEVTFMLDTSTVDDIRYLKMKIDSEGGGRWIAIGDEFCKGEMTFGHPDDLQMLADKAKELWEQGPIYCDNEGW